MQISCERLYKYSARLPVYAAGSLERQEVYSLFDVNGLPTK